MDHEPPRITRVAIENYKSIAHCDVSLGPLTFLVGRNGSGKSNFLDALRFLHESATSTLDYAMIARGGIEEMLYRPARFSMPLALRLEFQLAQDSIGSYALRIGETSFGGFKVLEERCEIQTGPAPERMTAYYRVAHGRMETSEAQLREAPLQPDRLAIVIASYFGPFRAVYDLLRGMGFYRIEPYRMRELQAPSVAPLLAEDGANTTSSLLRLLQRGKNRQRRVQQYLAAILLDLDSVAVKSVDRKSMLEFRLRGAPGEQAHTFPAASMSDGTLHALGVLLALFQLYGDTDHGPSLVGIEEPERALHPFATAAMRDALQEASASTQVIATSHSPDLLNDRDISADAIRVVSLENGATHIGPLDAASRRILEEDLYTVGELTRRVELRAAASGAAAATQAAGT